uniref:Endonuclease n=1 Tax=Ditylenchus dipsaci TaxID=166011 RepID=A0A915EA29_9BILA
MKFGYPGFDNLRTYEDFVLSYDRRTRTAHWVVEHLTPDRLVYDPSVDRSKSTFKPDTSIHTFFQSQNSDYLRSGYDRGHLAAAGNIEIGRGFNRDKWNDVEIHASCKKNRNVYICTGPLYLPQKESDGNFYPASYTPVTPSVSSNGTVRAQPVGGWLQLVRSLFAVPMQFVYSSVTKVFLFLYVLLFNPNLPVTRRRENRRLQDNTEAVNPGSPK